MEIQLSASSETLLAQMEKSSIPVETHCRSGICGMCRARLLKGKVAYQKEPLACLSMGEVLVCCAKAVTDVLLDV
ncbi:class I ribonucleotide reductase maintenance protein YfaE [Marinobacterium aestuariivivens]|uniref:Class I ribonucleotide reductase maintenance protein YfaE n=1 Tax=Marinobacterium aestuariivivens TaxID=1698799 RepID=A0ABW2A9T4_9GAMM